MKPAAAFAIAALAGLLAPGAPAAEPVGWHPVPESIEGVLTSVLDASGVRDGSERMRLAQSFGSLLADLRELDDVRSPYRRARKLHDALHAKVFRRYEADADGIQAALERGEYNCVSATLIEGMAARAFGLEPSVVESPRHLSLRLSLEGQVVDVDSASPSGFDARRGRERFGEFLLAYKLATAQEIEERGLDALWEEFNDLSRPVTLEEGVAFLWRNAGERALERGQAARGAEAYREAWALDPRPGLQFDRMLAALTRAFRIEYDAGRFETAYRISAIENEMLPGRASVEDRLMAASVQRVELATDAGNASLAEALLNESADALRGRARHLEIQACPRIVAEAVRASEWELAERMAERYGAAGADPVEASDLAAWIARRKAAAAGFSGKR